MRTILHLSDLHFGRVDPVVVEALTESAERLSPQLIAISGDLTQRARRREFMAARRFIDTLPGTKIVVPGNHDVPLYNIAARFLNPHARFRDHFARELEPAFIDEELVLVGVDTSRSLVFKGGRINRLQIQRVIHLFCGHDEKKIRILMTHHPFDLPPFASARDLVGRAAMAMACFSECMPDLLLAGHLHLKGAGTTTARYQLGGRSAIVVQAGTAASTRIRGEENSFNLIHVEPARIAVDRFVWSRDRRVFDFESTAAFVQRDGGWQSVDVVRV